jgi:nucleoside-diphosphate-sugar epimerase
MKTVGILGANGFIGSRLVEMLHLQALAEVRPIVRTAASMARLSRFSLEGRVADALDVNALGDALRGCDTLVHAIAGSAELIVDAAASAYRAAERAGVRRLIYLSSESVHGQSPAPGTTEESPLNDQQPIAYNNAKIRAERALRQARSRGKVELVILRPGIVLGPRSFWVGSFADAVLAGEAFIIGHGQGICNSIYVDNLVDGIFAALTAQGADGEAFFLGDKEQVTWADVYRPITEALGFDFNRLPRVEPVIKAEPVDRIEQIRSVPAVRAIVSAVPRRLRRIARANLDALRSPGRARSGGEHSNRIEARATLEQSLLQTCRHKLPHDKAARILGYEPRVSFRESCQRTVGWMTFAGYPVIGMNPSAR